MTTIRQFWALFAACLFTSGSCFGQTISWYKCFAGTIDKYPVTVHLHKAGHAYDGYYYYNSRQEPVSLSGNDTTEAGKIRLTVFLPGTEEQEDFIFSISGLTASGEWHAAGNKKTLAFSAKEVSPGLAFDYVYTEGQTLLRPRMKESPEAGFEAATVWPKGSSPQALLLKKLIIEEFGEKNTTDDIGKIFLRLKKQFFADYLEDYKDKKDEEMQESFSWEQNKKIMIVYNSPKLLMLAGYSYSYAGGAHGNYGTSYIPVDLVNNKKLKVDDVVTEAGKKQLARLLEKSFRKAYEVKDTDPLTEGGLFEDTIAANDNFYTTPKGIWFCYNPYEIASYAVGEIALFIPFSELNAYLQPGFKKLIQ